MATTIQIKRSSTASGVPLATDLAVGELAVNLADKRLFTKQSDGTIIELSTNPTDLDAATLRIDGVEITASATELNSLDGFTGSTAELNLLDGLTATTIELNTLDGITASTAELNKLDGYTGSAAELNILDGVTATTAEINFVDGVTSNIQTQLDAKQPLDAQLTDIAGLTPTDGTFIVGNGLNFVAESGDTAIASLGVTATASELNTLDGITATTAELNYTDGVTSNIQTQLDGKATTAQGTLADSAVQPNDNVSFGTGSFTGNVDVTGTVSADGLTIDGSGTAITLQGNNGAGTLNTLRFRDTDAATATGQDIGRLEFYSDDASSAGVQAYIAGQAAGGSGIGRLTFGTGSGGSAVDRMLINSNGDVSFYEDTGTTAKMVWDASAESLGIGTASPSYPLHISTTLGYPLLIERTNSNDAGIRFKDSNTTDAESVKIGAVGNDFRVITQSTERMRIGSSGNVGIGTSSPNDKLSVVGSIGINDGSNAQFRVSTSGTGDTTFFTNNGAGTNGTYGQFIFESRRGSNPTLERARLDSSGNLLVGKTSTAGTKGVIAYNTGALEAIRDGAGALFVNRLNSDGTIAEFRKDGSTVGSIGTTGGALDIKNAVAGGVAVTYENSTNALLVPILTNGSFADGLHDLGRTNARFKDLYLSGGVYLGGTGSANKLDDYEEGDFIPTIHDATSGGNVGTSSVADGKYVKIGKVVCARFRLQDIDTTGMTGANGLIIKGLPFTATTTQPAARVGPYGVVNVTLATGTVNLTGYAYSDYVVLEQQSLTNVVNLKVNQITSGTGDMYVSLTYQTN